jgi:hypothetical protein
VLYPMSPVCIAIKLSVKPEYVTKGIGSLVRLSLCLCRFAPALRQRGDAHRWLRPKKRVFPHRSVDRVVSTRTEALLVLLVRRKSARNYMVGSASS